MNYNVFKFDDPWFDNVDGRRLVGQARIYLESLAMQLDNQIDAKIMSTEGKPSGSVRLEVWPLSTNYIIVVSTFIKFELCSRVLVLEQMLSNSVASPQNLTR